MDVISYGDCFIRFPPVILVVTARGKARDSVKSDAEEAFAFQIRVLGIVPPEREYRFLMTRRWRFDFAWPSQMVAVEIEGGQYVKGRHNRPEGYAADIEKYNAAQLHGWRVFRFTPAMVTNGQAAGFVEDLRIPRMGQDG